MRGLYTANEPYDVGFLDVTHGHRLYYEQACNPQGKPVVVVHGGPGGGIHASYRQYHDPQAYRVILFDQRGCGKSTPHASLEHNTTWLLVDDIEELRKHLKIDKWQVFGGSWGSTLSLAYSQTHPTVVTELVLRGIFMLRRSELMWFYQSGADQIFPDAWEKYLEPIPAVERGDMMSAYYRRLTSSDEQVRLSAARAWSIWEGSTSHLVPHKDAQESDAEFDKFAAAFARIECHYFVNGGFFHSESHLLEGVDKIRHIPATIVQGRYDVVCPMRSAWDLHRAWPEAELKVTHSGHSCSEPGNIDELVKATDKYRDA